MVRDFNCSIIIVHLYLITARQSPLLFGERKLVKLLTKKFYITRITEVATVGLRFLWHQYSIKKWKNTFDAFEQGLKP